MTIYFDIKYGLNKLKRREQNNYDLIMIASIAKDIIVEKIKYYILKVPMKNKWMKTC